MSKVMKLVQNQDLITSIAFSSAILELWFYTDCLDDTPLGDHQVILILFPMCYHDPENKTVPLLLYLP
jgi:hypothetical protein